MHRNRSCSDCSTTWSRRKGVNFSSSDHSGDSWSATTKVAATGYGRSLNGHRNTCSDRCSPVSTGPSASGYGGASSTISSGWPTCSSGNKERMRSGRQRLRGSRSRRDLRDVAFTGRWSDHAPKSTARRCRCTRSGGRSQEKFQSPCPTTCRSSDDYSAGRHSCSCYSGYTS